MKLETLNDWIDALESGDYIQTDSFLLVEDLDGKERMCCLGVLWNVAGDEWVKDRKSDSEWGVVSHPKDDPQYKDDIYDTGQLPQWALDYVGLSPDDQRKLVVMNDEKNINFHGIALWLEDNIKVDNEV